MSQPGSRSRNEAHRQARTQALLHGAAKVPRTLDATQVGALQEAADESGRTHVAVIGGRESDHGVWFAVRVFQPAGGKPAPTEAATAPHDGRANR